MYTDDIAGGEMKEQTDATDTRNASNNSERRDFVPEQPDERPSSIVLQQSAIHRGRRSSLTSCGGSGSDLNTPDPDIENSLAYTSTSKSREGSVKRTKKSLPPGEPNEVTERIAVSVDLPGLFRNKLIAAALNHAEEERRVLRNHTPDSMKMDDTNSSVSTEHSTSTMHEMESFEQDNTERRTTSMPEMESFEQENTERRTTSMPEMESFEQENTERQTTSTMPEMESFEQENMDEETPSIDINSRPSTRGKERLLVLEDKTVKSESCLLNIPRVDSYVQRAQSAPVEVTSTCTQTEWSWIEDMKKYEQMKSEMQTDETFAKAEKEDSKESSNLPVPQTEEVKGALSEKSIKDDESEDELFRPPTLEYSSSSSDEDDGVEVFERESFLPSIGPPKILQYVKESVNPPFTNECAMEEVAARFQTPTSSREGHSCAFCKVEALEKSLTAEHVCLAEAAKHECPVYHEHVKQQFVHKEDDDFVTDEIIDVRPHPPFGTKAARKEAKERAAARAREREAERQKVSGASVNYYAMTRQMKTLTYSLASTKCMDDGWTVRPLSPVRTESSDHLEPFEIEINSSRAQRRETFMERFYQNGNRLLVLFPDGTGCCYYPSGNPAVIISSTEKGKYSYILQEDTHEHSRENTGVLGVFDPTGHGSCYYQQTGKLRMVLTPFGGTFFDIKGEKKKKWFWYNITGSYVHAPPFQPITFAWTKELSLRCMGQDYIIITYNHGRHTIRFNVGARLKPVVKKVKLPTDEEYYDMQLKEIRKFVNLLIGRVQTTLRFPHSHRIHKLQVPERRQSKASRVESRVIDDNTTDDKTTVVVN